MGRFDTHKYNWNLKRIFYANTETRATQKLVGNTEGIRANQQELLGKSSMQWNSIMCYQQSQFISFISKKNYQISKKIVPKFGVKFWTQ